MCPTQVRESRFVASVDATWTRPKQIGEMLKSTRSMQPPRVGERISAVAKGQVRALGVSGDADHVTRIIPKTVRRPLIAFGVPLVSLLSLSNGSRIVFKD
jgi:hypothetical protein